MGPEKKEIAAITTKFVAPKISVMVSNLHVAAIANPVIYVHAHLHLRVRTSIHSASEIFKYRATSHTVVIE